jgi:hypothetical protein
MLGFFNSNSKQNVTKQEVADPLTLGRYLFEGAIPDKLGYLQGCLFLMCADEIERIMDREGVFIEG